MEDEPTPEEPKTQSQILKEENDALQAEMERAQKIRNEALLAGTAGGKVEAKPAPEISPQDYVEKVMNGEVEDVRED